MLTTLKSLPAKVRALLTRYRPTVAALAGAAALAIDTGVASGAAGKVAGAVIVAATVFGVHVTARPPKTKTAGLDWHAIVGTPGAINVGTAAASNIPTTATAPTPPAPPAPKAGQ